MRFCRGRLSLRLLLLLRPQGKLGRERGVRDKAGKAGRAGKVEKVEKAGRVGKVGMGMWRMEPRKVKDGGVCSVGSGSRNCDSFLFFLSSSSSSSSSPHFLGPCMGTRDRGVFTVGFVKARYVWAQVFLSSFLFFVFFLLFLRRLRQDGTGWDGIG